MSDPSPPADDGMLAPEVGPWSQAKHHFLRRYIDIFTVGMKNKRWALHYVDLFAGAGVEQVKDGNRDWGSPLIAAQAKAPFAQLHLCERDPEKFDALSKRLNAFPQPSKPQLINDDANKAVKTIIGAIPSSESLTLAFLDPYGLHLDFETVRALAGRRTDFIIFFPDHIDMLRNWRMYGGQDESNLDRFMGTRAWRDFVQETPQDRLAEAFRHLYVEQVRRLGYEHFDFERIERSDGVPLYQLIFCSKHERGGEFWRKIAQRKADGQGSFNFGDKAPA